MKNLIIIGLLLLEILNFNSATAQCQSSFSYVNNGNGVISFTNTTPGYTAATNCGWSFGATNYYYNYSSVPSPQYTYFQNGTYVVSLVSGSCDIVYDTIVINDFTNCTATFYYNGPTGWEPWINFYPQFSGPPPFTYSWDYGDGTPSGSNNSHSYNYGFNDTSYYVTLTVTDSMGCVAVFSDSVYIPAQSGYCNPNTEINYDPFTGFANFNVSPLVGTFYSWDFGDGTFSGEPNITHQYAAPGNYISCLYVDTCGATFCDTLYIDSIYVTGVNNDELKEESLLIYPNPASSIVYVELVSITPNNQIQLMDVAGKLVENYTSKILSGRIELGIENLSNGVYFITVTNSSLEITQKGKFLIVN